MSEATTLKALKNGDGSVTFKSSGRGNEAGNRRSAYAADLDTAVTFYFDKPVKSFQITYDTVAGGRKEFPVWVHDLINLLVVCFNAELSRR